MNELHYHKNNRDLLSRQNFSNDHGMKKLQN